MLKVEAQVDMLALPVYVGRGNLYAQALAP